METQNVEAPASEVVVETPVETTPVETVPEEVSEVQMSDEEIDALVQSLLNETQKEETPAVTEPTFFNEEKGKETVNELAIISELIDKQAQDTIEKEKLEQENAEAVKVLEQIQSTVAEKQAEIDAINGLYSNIESVLTPDIAKALAFNDTDNIPAFLIKEKREAVENHPFVGPLVKSLLEGNEVDIPKLLREAISKSKTLPNV